MALQMDPVVLPFHTEKASFALSYKSADAPAVDIDLSCICFDRDGRILDSLQHNVPSALNGALKHNTRDSSVPAGDRISADQAIHLYPFHFAPECEVMLLVASAAASPSRRMDLSTTGRLSFSVTAREKDAAAAQQVLPETDLLPLVSEPKEAAGALSNGHQSIIIAAVYTTPQGWAVKLDGTTSSADAWGEMAVVLRSCLSSLPGVLAGAQANATDAAAATAAVFTRPGEDRPLAVPGAAAPTKLRLDVGWALWKKAADAEETSVEFTIGCYDLQGEALGTVTVSGEDCPEAEGIEVLEPPPEPEEADEEEGEEQAEQEAGEEAEQEAAEAEAAEEEAAEEGEAGGKDEEEQDAEGEEGGEVVEPEGQEAGEDATGKEESAAEGEAGTAEAAPAPAATAARKLEPIKPFNVFPLKRQAIITLAELPQGTRTIVVSMANMAGSGLKDVSSLQVRLMDVSSEPASSRPLLVLRMDSAKGQGAELTQALMFKLYLEPQGSAFNLWSGTGRPDVESLLDASFAQAELLKAAQDAAKAAAQAEAAARAAAEEEGTDPDELAPTWLASATWRLQAWALARGGEGLEELADEMQGLLAYEGGVDAGGRRNDAAAKAVYPNRDTYFGGYSSDAKSGAGLYVFTTGAAYLGAYEGGKRHGQGLLLLPDGGMYRGGFVGDKYEGEGEYRYPNGSCYNGAWKAGLKHGQGSYRDTAGGCLSGAWAAGVMMGQGLYEQPHYKFEGQWFKGVPAGPCTFTLGSTYRSQGLSCPAATHLRAAWGPTLAADGQYTIPAGADAPLPEGQEEGEAQEDGDKPHLPTFPKYEGLGFVPAAGLPRRVPDVAYTLAAPPLGACG